ncbi:MAG: carbohydrate kinase family protein [Lachnospiraceae bacterium]|nr:carbohydrate kinase family protein [Lachnospiraceae bacterium]
MAPKISQKVTTNLCVVLIICLKQFPIEYFPIDYSFFGVNTRVSGVAYNLAKALKTLGDDVRFVSMMGNDFSARYIKGELAEIGISSEYVTNSLKATPSSVVLYDDSGKRQIYCDLKDIQEATLDGGKELYEDCDIVMACNANFNRGLLRKAKADNKIIVTDVHVLSDINDEYNKDFMQYANILFLSDENIKGEYKEFIMEIEKTYKNDIIILGRGSKGVLMYVRNDEFASYKIGFDGASVGFATEEKVEEYINKVY